MRPVAEPGADPHGTTTMRRLISSVPLLAVLLSVLLHVVVLVPAIGLLGDPPEDRSDPPEPATIEMLPVEVAGAEAAPETRPVDSPEPLERVRSDPDPPRPVAEIANASGEPDTSAETNMAAEPDMTAQPATPNAPNPLTEPPRMAAEARPSVAVPETALSDRLVLSFAGTDSASNATATGPNLIPASPDDRTRNRPPVYPREAARRGEQGTVLVLIRVSSMGLAEGAEVLASSGHHALDRAAVAAVMTWRFRPAIQDGRAIPFEMPMRIVFAMQ